MPKIKKLTARILLCFSIISDQNALAEQATAPTMTTANAEFVYKYLLGEIAGQRGDAVLASQLFLTI